MTSLTARVIRKATEAFRPPMKQKLSTWMEKELRLPDSVAVPGPVRLYKYQHGIADAISDPRYERVTVLKAARIGYTMTLIGAIGNHVVNDPANVLCVLPTIDDCSRFMVSDVEPLFDASPALRGALVGEKGKKSRVRLLAKRFAGGELRVVAAKSPRNLASHTSRVLILDEVDRMAVGKEGSPVAVAIRRTMTFRDRKIILGSSPVYTETSLTIKAYEQSDKRVFECPCPHCGTPNELRWADIHWPEGRPDQAYYVPPCCGAIVTEDMKADMVAKGEWRATAQHVIGHAGFRISALVSTLANAAWGKLATEFVQAKDDPTDLQAFVNTVLGEGWSLAEGEEIDESVLYNRREEFSLDDLPEDVVAITVGVDVQHSWLEVVTVGWSRDGIAYVLDHRRIEGGWDDDVTWRELDDFLQTRWRHPYGAMLGVESAAIDSSDGVTMDAVYSFAFPRSRRRVLAVKGMPGPRPWILPSIQKRRGGVLWQVGVDSVKTALFDRLKRPGLVRFSKTLEMVFFEQLCGERMKVTMKRGQPVREFFPVKGRRHECLDATVYAMAAWRGLNIDYDRRESDLRQEPKPTRRIEPAVNYVTGEAA